MSFVLWRGADYSLQERSNSTQTLGTSSHNESPTQRQRSRCLDRSRRAAQRRPIRPRVKRTRRDMEDYCRMVAAFASHRYCTWPGQVRDGRRNFVPNNFSGLPGSFSRPLETALGTASLRCENGSKNTV